MLTALKFPPWAKRPAPAPRRDSKVVRKPYGKELKLGWGVKSALMAALLFYCFLNGAIYAVVTPYYIVQLLLPAAVLAFVVIWALPDLHVAPTKTLERLFFAFFFVMIAWPNYLAVALPGMPWITIQRLVDFPMTALFLICVSTYPPFRATSAAVLKSSPWLCGVICAFIAVQVMSLFVSGDPAYSIAKLINAQTDWIVIFFVGCYVFQKDGRITQFIYMMMGLCAFLGVISLWERQLGHLPWAGHVPGFLKIEDPIVAYILSAKSRFGGGLYRVQATFTTSLGLSEYLALMSPFVLHVIFEKYPRNAKIAAVIILPMMVRACVLTQSRTGMFGMLLASLLYPGIWIFLEWRRNRSSLAAACAVALSPLFATLLLGSTFIVPGLRYRLWNNTGANQYSTQARIDQWHMGVPKVLSHPWGYGIGRGATVLGYLSPGGGLTIDSYPLRLLLEYGVQGTLIFYGMLVAGIAYAVNTAYKTSSDKDSEARIMLPLAVALACYILMKTVYAQEDNHPIIFVFFAMIAAVRFRTMFARTVKAETSQLVPSRAVA